MTRTIEAMVDEQARRWQLVRSERHEDAHRPVVTVSRQHGAGGAAVAKTLATEFKRAGVEVRPRRGWPDHT